MSRKLTKEEKKNLKSSFDAYDNLLRESQGVYFLFSWLCVIGRELKCTASEALEIILREYSELIEDRIRQEVKQAGVPKEEIDETVAIIMRMINPWIAKNSFLAKYQEMLIPKKSDSEGGFGV